MKFQVLSDLHLHPRKRFDLRKASDDVDALILAGDIGAPESDSYQWLVQDAAQLFKYVFVVAGNHEHYGHVWQRTMEIITCTCRKYTNVYHLNCCGVDIPNTNIRVVGATLWSHILPFQEEFIALQVNDFRCIHDWSTDKHMAKHKRDLKYITREALRCQDTGRRLVVITHHAPLEDNTSHPKHTHSPVSSSFSSDLEHLFGRPIVAWVFGHTHYCVNSTINGVKLVSNQLGYDDEQVERFDPCFVVDV